MKNTEWTESAPANIALIKYMGKADSGNVATNPSLSMTLSQFKTSVSLSLTKEKERWEPLPNSAPLRAESTVRFMNFLARLKEKENIQENFLVKSGNNFPSDAGLASSASSFAALTKAAYTAFSELSGKTKLSPEKMASISRTGSGSSCRSFFSPWCAWDGGEKVYAPESKLVELTDVVVVHDGGFKKVSSSDAHKKVKSSPLFERRPERAVKRMEQALQALATNDYKTLAEISYAELWDMHSLFHTSEPPFFYFAPETIAVLRFVEELWEKKGKGPIATIDAGPNVHLLMPKTEKAEILAELKQFLGYEAKLLESGA